VQKHLCKQFCHVTTCTEGADNPPGLDSPPGTTEQMGSFDAQFQVIT